MKQNKLDRLITRLDNLAIDIGEIDPSLHHESFTRRRNAASKEAYNIKLDLTVLQTRLNSFFASLEAE